MHFTEDDAQQLSRKLVALELTPGQRSALDAVFDAATRQEVTGYMIRPVDRYASIALAARSYIGETEKGLGVFEPNNQPRRYS